MLVNIAFRFSDCGLSLDPVLHREFVVLPSNHLTFGVSGVIMSQPSKSPRLLQPREISELIVDTDIDEASVSSDFSSVEGGYESGPGLSQPQPSAKQPVVTSPAVQFRPVPLTKRILVRVGQV